tara:strand:+ start:5912 stop:8494 length:2583 start_codon:yes stop_codon:yes gene_type:complete
MTKSINAVIFLFFVSLFTPSVFANTSSAATQAEISQIIKAEKVADDDFHKIMESMWGGFIFSDPNADPTMLSQVVGYVNVLALVLGIIIVTYVSVASVINSAQSGEVLGRQWNSYWLPIRTAMAFGLLVPTKVGAFALSTAQVIVIKLVIMASTSATFLWNKAVEDALGDNQSTPTVVLPYKLAYETSLTTACAITTARELNMGDPSVIKFRFSDDSIEPIDILEDEAAMSGDTSAFTRKIIDVRNRVTNGDFITSISFWEGACGRIDFNIPSFDFNEITPYTSSDANSVAKATFQGSVDIAQYQLKEYQVLYINYLENFATKVVNSGDSNFTSLTLPEKREVVRNQSAYDAPFGVVAQNYLNELEDEDRAFSLMDVNRTSSSARATTSEKIIAKMSLYKMYIDEFVLSVEALYENYRPPINYSGSLKDQIKMELTKGGWIYAGSFFYKISQIEGKVHESSSAMISGSSSAGVIKCKNCSESSSHIANSELLSLMYKHSYITPIKIGGNLDGKLSPHSEALGVPLVSSHSMNDGINEAIISDTASAWAINVLADFGANGISDTNLSGNELGDVSKNNPFQFAVNVGHGMNNLRYSLMAMKLVMTTYVYTIDYAKSSVDSSVLGLAGVGAAASPVVALLKAAAMMALELVTIAITLLTAMSWILAYYIPMMPALLWITLIGAYLLIVIEAVVATPLAVVLMATPEGEGISGSKMQNAITLLASVYLRPSLMIVGLIAAIYVAKYSFMILNTIFWSQAESAVSGDLFAFFAIFSLYITALHQVLSNSIKSMDSLPTAILNWIGQGANAQFGQNEISGAGDQLGAKEDSFGKTGDSFKQIFDQQVNNQRNDNLANKISKGGKK